MKHSAQVFVLDTMRAMIVRPQDFTKAQFCETLTDAGEVIIMLERIVAKHVRALPDNE